MAKGRAIVNRALRLSHLMVESRISRILKPPLVRRSAELFDVRNASDTIPARFLVFLVRDKDASILVGVPLLERDDEKCGAAWRRLE
jgi:hypothetical protein